MTTTDLRYLYDEWDYAIDDYRPHWCELREVSLQGDDGAFFSKTLATYADLTQEIKREFQRLRPRMYHPVKGLEDGEEIDLNATVAARVAPMLCGWKTSHLSGCTPTRSRKGNGGGGRWRIGSNEK